MGKGKVYLIGAGPGDPDLLTIKAAKCIKRADVIVYDRLVNSRILDYAADEAEMVYVGKKPGFHCMPQAEINRILVKKSMEEKTVARIKGGDPFVFGRGGEEAEELVKNNVEFEIVPGITSAVAAPAYAGIPVTHRDYSSSFHVVTGHEARDGSGVSIDYEALARIQGTLVFLMGIGNIRLICNNLMKHGKNPHTPAAVVENGSGFNQKTVTGTLEDIHKKVLDSGINPPSVTVIGNVVKLGKKLSWFPRGPLKGRRILVTRSRGQSKELVEKIEGLGGEAVVFPVIKITRPDSFSKFDIVLNEIRLYKWLVFTSANGVEAFFSRMKDTGMDLRLLSKINICAVGAATKGEVLKHGILCDFVRQSHTGKELLADFLKIVAPGEKVLLARSDIAGNNLPESLKKAGIEFTELKAYKTVGQKPSNTGDIINMLNNGKLDYITFTSSSTVKNFVKSIGKGNIGRTRDLKVVCIGRAACETAVSEGFAGAVPADEHTIDSLLDLIVKIEKGGI